MAFVSTRRQTIAGREYKRGQTVADDVMSSDKFAQLVEQRRLRSTETRPAHFTATRTFTIDKRDYKRGTTIDVSAWPEQKIAQLLEQRYIEPAA